MTIHPRIPTMPGQRTSGFTDQADIARTRGEGQECNSSVWFVPGHDLDVSRVKLRESWSAPARWVAATMRVVCVGLYHSIYQV